MTRSALAIAIWLASSAVSAIALALIATSWNAELPRAWGFRGFTAVFAVLFGTVGLLIVRRQPAHLVGWILLAAGSLSAVQQLAEEYAVRTLDAFSARLRNEVALDAVRADLLTAVGDTVRPAHASVWLRQTQR